MPANRELNQLIYNNILNTVNKSNRKIPKGCKMIEVNRTYTKAEMNELLGRGTNANITRKLTRYTVDFEIKGRGNNAIYTINDIGFPFKVFCILNLGFDGNTDFKKVRNFYYYYFNDDTFMILPDETKEYLMRKQHYTISRQTIATYTRKLEQNEIINRNTDNFVYYFAYKHKQSFVERNVYSRAWREYWSNIDEGVSSIEAIDIMRVNYGGVARKQAIPEINGINKDEIDYMIDLIQMDFERELEKLLKSRY